MLGVDLVCPECMEARDELAHMAGWDVDNECLRGSRHRAFLLWIATKDGIHLEALTPASLVASIRDSDPAEWDRVVVLARASDGSECAVGNEVSAEELPRW
jgi:hypothetical protein